MRSGPNTGALNDEALLHPTKVLEQYEKVFAQHTEFFSSYSPDMIEEAILASLKQEGVNPEKVSAQKYKIKFTITTKDQGGQEHNTQISVRILGVSEKINCVEFMKVSGDKTRFVEHYKEFKNKILDFMNDSVVDKQ